MAGMELVPWKVLMQAGLILPATIPPGPLNSRN